MASVRAGVLHDGRDVIDRIEILPRVCGGKPVIAGTRIPVTIILELLESGESWDSLLKAYPELSIEDIRGAIHYAKAAVDSLAEGVEAGSHSAD